MRDVPAWGSERMRMMPCGLRRRLSGSPTRSRSTPATVVAFVSGVRSRETGAIGDDPGLGICYVPGRMAVDTTWTYSMDDTGMRITGRDFMAWYDAWCADPASAGLVWENDGSVAVLHDEGGRWILDVDREFDLSELGEIDHEITDGPRRAPPDTETIVRSWLARRGMHHRTLVVPVAHAEALRSILAGHIGEDVAEVTILASTSSRRAYGADLTHFARTAFPEDCLIEEGGLLDEGGEPILAPDAIYDMHDLIEVSGPVSLDDAFAAYLEGRTTRPMPVIVPEWASTILDAVAEGCSRMYAADPIDVDRPNP